MRSMVIHGWKAGLALVLLGMALTASLPAAAQSGSTRPSASAKKAGPTTVRKTKAKARKPVVPARPSFGQLAGLHGTEDPLDLKSSVALVIDQDTNQVLFSKNPEAVLPIASITKLMTAMVALDAKPALDEVLEVSEEDIDQLKGTRSRLAIGTRLTREEMLHLALMSSENRASSALSRYYPGGHAAFIAAMNRKAHDLGLADTQFFDSTGLNPRNVSSARDLAKMVAASASYPLIREFSTTRDGYFAVNGRMVHFNNTNALVSNPEWEIGLQKTGFTNEAGKCLVMQAWMNQKPVVIVLLDSWGRLTRIGDANRIRRWVEQVAQQGARQG